MVSENSLLRNIVKICVKSIKAIWIFSNGSQTYGNFKYNKEMTKNQLHKTYKYLFNVLTAQPQQISCWTFPDLQQESFSISPENSFLFQRMKISTNRFPLSRIFRMHFKFTNSRDSFFMYFLLAFQIVNICFISSHTIWIYGFGACH